MTSMRSAVLRTCLASAGALTVCLVPALMAAPVSAMPLNGEANNLTVTKTATATYGRTFLWEISKSGPSDEIIADGDSLSRQYSVTVTPKEFNDGDRQLIGTITIDNPNTVAVPASVSDVVDIDGALGTSCTLDAVDITVPASGSVGVGYNCTFESVPDGAFEGTNTATVTWDGAALGSPGSSATGVATFTGTQNGSAYKVIQVRDTAASPAILGSADYDDGPTTFTYSVDVPGVAGSCEVISNTATIVDTGLPASHSFTLCVGADLQASKTAAGSLTRTYKWSINKTAGPVTGSAGTTVPYAVTLAPDGRTDSNRVVTGAVTVTNPNNWQAIRATVTELPSFGVPATCTLSYPGGGTSVLVAASASVDVGYSCTVSGQPTGGPTNNAQVDWNSVTAHTPAATTTASAPVLFTPSVEVNKTVTVTDDQAGLGTVTLGSRTWTAGPQTFSYSVAYPAPGTGCVTKVNTATITQTGQSDSASAQVCAPGLGAKPVSYWQTGAGRDVILAAGTAPGSTTCALTPYLRGYGPFSSLGANARCSTVATWVTNQMARGTVGGASVKNQLRAQMLGTALNVYFSDPALGGNDIGAPAPIGGVSVQVGGYAPAFGAAATSTVSGMLSYASSQYVVATKAWYGGVVATQTKARDGFLAVNTNVIPLG